MIFFATVPSLTFLTRFIYGLAHRCAGLYASPYTHTPFYERGQKLCDIQGTFVRCARKCQTKIRKMVIQWEGYVGF